MECRYDVGWREQAKWQLWTADAIVFSGGIGTHAVKLREGICSSLGYAGVTLDTEANNAAHSEMRITTPESKIAVYVIPTDEEMMIAMDTYESLAAAV